MIGRIVLLMFVYTASLFGRFETEAIDASLSALGAEEGLSAPLETILERYDSHIPVLYARYRETKGDLAPIEARLTEAGIPLFFSLLPYPESKFNPKARGYNTAGLWQFSRQSARNFGLTVKKGNDERLDPLRSTDAMVRYLKSLHRDFGSWHLTAFAYAMGEGNLQRIIDKHHSTKISVLLKDPHFPSGAKASFAKTLLLDAKIHHAPPPETAAE